MVWIKLILPSILGTREPTAASEEGTTAAAPTALPALPLPPTIPLAVLLSTTSTDEEEEEEGTATAAASLILIGLTFPSPASANPLVAEMGKPVVLAHLVQVCRMRWWVHGGSAIIPLPQTYMHIDRKTDRQTDRHTDRQTHRHTDRQTDRQTDTQTDTHTYPSHPSTHPPTHPSIHTPHIHVYRRKKGQAVFMWHKRLSASRPAASPLWPLRRWGQGKRSRRRRRGSASSA